MQRESREALRQAAGTAEDQGETVRGRRISVNTYMYPLITALSSAISGRPNSHNQGAGGRWGGKERVIGGECRGRERGREREERP